MPVNPNVRNEFLSYPRALLTILILLSSACGYLQGEFDHSPSQNMEVGQEKESPGAASKLDANRSLGRKHNVGVVTPEPKLSGKGNGTESVLKRSLKHIILEGYTLKNGMEKEYRSYKDEKTFEVHARKFTREWSLKVAKWAGNAEDVLKEIDSVAPERFKVYRGQTVPRGGGDEKWGTIDSWVNDKLDFLERFSDNFGKR